MKDEQFYRDGIVRMIFSISNVEWLWKIYSFISVFTDDKEGKQ